MFSVFLGDTKDERTLLGLRRTEIQKMDRKSHRSKKGRIMTPKDAAVGLNCSPTWLWFSLLVRTIRGNTTGFRIDVNNSLARRFV